MSSTAKQREADLDAVFSALSDTTRRRILSQLSAGPKLVGELAEPFSMSLPAVCKHLDVLERAGLLRREREGRVSRCFLETRPLETASAFIERQRTFWSDTLDSLAEYVEQPAARRGKVRSND
jgi:DNA-binding transcriptional ArsR family regulator